MTAATGLATARTTFRPPNLRVLPEAIAQNVAVVRARTRSKVMAVVKADGYGHGAITVARAAVAAGADWLGTTDVAEAVELRAAGLTTPILTWLHPSGIDAETAAIYGIDVAVGSPGELSSLTAQRSLGLRIHLHLDTGMAREGCPAAEWDALIADAAHAHRAGRIRLVGLMGHLPRAEEAAQETNAPAVARIRSARRAMAMAGFGAPLTHLAATAGALTDPGTHFDLVRVGAGLVGIDPSGTTALRGAARLTAPVVHSTSVSAGTPVGYGGRHITSRPTHLAVLPVGYADGIPRELSSDAAVEIRGQRCRIVGQVSMDQIVVDTGADDIARGTTATVFGPAGGTTPTIHDWARWAGTIPHTIVTGLGPRISRKVMS